MTTKPRPRTPLPDMLFNPNYKALPKITLQPPTLVQGSISAQPLQHGNRTNRRRPPPNEPALLYPTWKKLDLLRRVRSKQPTNSDPTPDSESKADEPRGKKLTHKLRSLADRVRFLKSSSGEKKSESKGGQGGIAPENVPGPTEQTTQGTTKSTPKGSMTAEKAYISRAPEKVPKRSATDPIRCNTSAKSPQPGPKAYTFSDADIEAAVECLIVLSELCEENRKPDDETQKLLLEIMGQVPGPITRRNRRKEFQRAQQFLAKVREHPGMERWKDVDALDALEDRVRCMYKFEERVSTQPSKVTKRTQTMYLV
ncbi:hypothetical protein QQZ08_000891 [Neonectria magnoliae]|uniref:Uncharacterized protein n=1 Tax=Neonectria magnoliae TaxID=2732573 RepID=A0ABR1IHP2_9HYPO